jgi:hypothetical protein
VPKPAPAPPKLLEKKPAKLIVPPKVELKNSEPPKVVPPKIEEKKIDPPKPAVFTEIPKTQPVIVQELLDI